MYVDKMEMRVQCNSSNEHLDTNTHCYDQNTQEQVSEYSAQGHEQIVTYYSTFKYYEGLIIPPLTITALITEPLKR